MNRRAVCVMISTAAACFHAGLWAGVVVRDVAIQDLTPSLSSLLLAANGSDFSMTATNGNLARITGKPITPHIVLEIERQNVDVCHEVENPSSPTKLGIQAGEFIDPAMLVIHPLKWRYGVDAVGKIGTLITRPPLHGTLIAGEWSRPTESAPLATFQYYKYVPTSGFIGKDKIAFEITVNGKKFRVSISINVLASSNNGESCVQGSEGSSGSSNSSNFAWCLESLDEVLPAQAGTADQWLRSASLAALLSPPPA